jgi:lysophospholipase L1-like esterase
MRTSLLCALTLAAHSFVWAQSEHWVGTWATSPVPQSQTPPANATPANTPPLIADSTIREIVHVSIGGKQARVVLTNAFGNAQLNVGAASIATRDHDAAIKAGSSHALSFAGKASVTVPPGGSMISDPVSIDIAPMSDLAIDLYFPADALAATAPYTYHSGAYQTNYFSKPGNFAGSADFPVKEGPPRRSWYFLSRVDVASSTPAIVTFGDSITDGTASTVDTNHRWPDLLFKRLSTEKGASLHAILNEAIAGNRLLNDGIIVFGVNALARFDRDVLPLPGATHMVVLEGINDIGNLGTTGTPATADQLIAAHQQLIERAHQKGLKVIGATLTPFEGARYFTPDGEVKRQAVNAWIRSMKGSPHYDAVIDFDAATRDTQAPTKFNPKYDSGDHLHPNDAGYEAMAAAIDLKLFGASQAKDQSPKGKK